MSVETVRSVLLYCGIINYAMLLFWIALHLLAPRLYHWIGRVYRVPPEQFDAIQLGGIVFYKLCILMFNVIPYIALLLIG